MLFFFFLSQSLECVYTVQANVCGHLSITSVYVLTDRPIPHSDSLCYYIIFHSYWRHLWVWWSGVRIFLVSDDPLVSVLRSVVWRVGARPEWNHRKPWVPSRLPQLCQLHVDHSDGRKEPNTALLSHLRSRGGLWHRVHLRWTATTREPEDEVGVLWVLFGHSQSDYLRLMGCWGQCSEHTDYNHMRSLFYFKKLKSGSVCHCVVFAHEYPSLVRAAAFIIICSHAEVGLYLNINGTRLFYAKMPKKPFNYTLYG